MTDFSDPFRPMSLQIADPKTSLRPAAEQLETLFLTEMLIATSPDTAGIADGGAGAVQFDHLMHRAQAEKIVISGGIGLTESQLQALQRNQ